MEDLRENNGERYKNGQCCLKGKFFCEGRIVRLLLQRQV